MLKDIFKTDRKALYIAEIGLNHNGDLNMARNMISSAKGAGADAVKFQTFVPEYMNSIYTSSLLYKGIEDGADPSIVDFFKKFVLSKEEYIELKAFAESIGVVFFSSVFDPPSVQMLEDIGLALYKLASSEVTNHILIEMVAKTGKPAILSTGISTEKEIEMAVDLFKKYSSAELILMHCVSLYPLDLHNANLNRIKNLHERFNLEVGFSDHTKDILASILAAGVGARIFEKHFTIDRIYDCPDKDISLDPIDFSRMVDSIENAVMILGQGAISYTSAEENTAKAARKSLFARKFIPKGKIVDEDDLIALRPGIGIPVYDRDQVIGKVSRIDIKKDFLIKLEYFE